MINALASEHRARLVAVASAAVLFLGLAGCSSTSSAGDDQVVTGRGGSRR